MKKQSVRFLAYLGFPIVVVLGLIHACGEVDTPTSSFATYQDAVSKNALGPSKWLPSWLPSTAMLIREAHSIDSNLVWLEFQHATGVRELGQKCRPIDLQEMQKALPKLPSGFPRLMRDSRERFRIAQADTVAVQCGDEHVQRSWIAVQSKGSDVVVAWTLE